MSLLKLLSVLTLVLFSRIAGAQEELRTRFPLAEAVYTNVVCEVNIEKLDGKWIALTDHKEDLSYLTENSLKMMSRGRIYHSSFNELKKWDAYTRVNNKKLKVTNTSTASSRQDYIFYDDTKATSFDFAGIGLNTSRHIDYQLLLNDIHLLYPHYFERYFPVGEGTLRISFPSDIKMKYLLKGDQSDKIVFTETKKKDKTIWTFQVKDMIGRQPFPDAPDNSYYATHIIYYVEQVKENNEWKNFLSSPEDLYRYSYGFIKDLDRSVSKELKSITDTVISGAKSDMEKAGRIYKWVQSNIKYVAFEDGMEGFVPRPANLVCSRRFGDCKDMTSILVAMLTHAGVPAYFTWIGTREIPYDYTEVPLPIVDNHMICTIKIGEEYLFLDGTDDGCIFGFPPSGIQGKQAMVSITEKDFKVIRVPVVPLEKNAYVDSTFLELGADGMTGRISVRLSGYFASSLYSILKNQNEKDHADYFKRRYGRGNNKIRFSNWKWNVSEDHNTAQITADLELPDYAKKMRDEWFLNMNLVKWFEHDLIDVEKRNLAIEYDYMSRFSIVTALKIPEGYQLDHLPKGDQFKNDAWGFKMNYIHSGNSVYLNQEFATDKLMTMPYHFTDLNKVLEKLTAHYKQTILLSKKQL
ncbi:MAG: transglutaminase domain-containing protein [Flavisolibacter sp.]|jgi:hypothetical protein|nr:transglutaminase domain-containing protein [Flavisolibacter sp.]